MMTRRRSRGFEQVGRVNLRESGLRRNEARRLLLLHGWRRVAGEPVASRLAVRRVVAGTLEIEAEPRWAATLEPVLGSLVGRLAARVPELGIRRYRLRAAGESEARAAVPVSPEPAGRVADSPPIRPAEAPRSDSGSAVELQDRLEQASRRYLERSGRSSR